MGEARHEIREITDPRMLRALAHPLRLRLLNELAMRGPATATELAEQVGESPSNCSWHLRQLARFGYVEEAEGGVGRSRPWRWIPTGHRWGDPDDSPEMVRAGEEMGNALVTFELAQRNAWEATRSAEPADWQRAAYTNQSVTWLTVEELAELNTVMTELMSRHLDRIADPATRPEGARPVRLIAWGIPSI
ncbi:transcriptional regulator [Catellatospora sp. TT07R-123]|uniref:winged helix-turn-helix domain-containing protein n=1 Tax=Catellatospora sp. TT07R-123 TaxID=2733863 RepID=UPI001B049CD4|nr:winged helix-turn-helix domain-containing protein [Catellatospora sp. TT07R-123]GHJ50193.1 transcriptional regulator [Catellatospora sp. TT07R-123]